MQEECSRSKVISMPRTSPQFWRGLGERGIPPPLFQVGQATEGGHPATNTYCADETAETRRRVRTHKPIFWLVS